MNGLEFDRRWEGTYTVRLHGKKVAQIVRQWTKDGNTKTAPWAVWIRGKEVTTTRCSLVGERKLFANYAAAKARVLKSVGGGK